MKQKKELTTQQWEATFDAITDIVLILSPDNTILAANKAACEAVDQPLNKLIGQTCFRVVHNQDHAIKECPCEKMLKTKSPEFSDYENDGKHYLLSAWPILSETGEIKSMIHTVRDITEQKRAEEQLIETKTEWEETFNTISDMITVHDKDFNIIRANQAAKKLLNLPLLDVMPGAKCFRYYHGTDAAPEGCPSCNCLESGLPATFELFEPHLDMFVEIRAIPRFDSKHELTGLIHVVRDITERKKTEETMIEAREKAEESDRIKSAFLENISHEIRTPMNGILGFSELLKEPDLLPENRDNYLSTIHKSSHQLLSIINDIVNISKIESGKETVNITDIHLQDFIDSLYLFFQSQADQRKLKLIFHVSNTAEDVMFRTDEAKLRLILINILGNALKFTEEGLVKMTVDLRGKHLQFTIQDTGIGIEPKFHQTIFDRFRQADITSTRKYGGTGLGLSISKSYTEILGGHIKLDSAAGEGTTFVIEIPYHPGNPVEPKPVSGMQDTTIDWSSKTILLAEDEEDHAILITTILRPTGIHIIYATNGQDALKFCNENDRVDLVLTDLRMPEMDGFEAVKRIKSIHPELPVIAVTAYTLINDKDRAWDSGCNDYLTKPIRPKELIRMLRKYLSD